MDRFVTLFNVEEDRRLSASGVNCSVKVWVRSWFARIRINRQKSPDYGIINPPIHVNQFHVVEMFVTREPMIVVTGERSPTKEESLECVPHAMWRQRNPDTAALTPSAHAFVDGAARQVLSIQAGVGSALNNETVRNFVL